MLGAGARDRIRGSFAAARIDEANAEVVDGDAKGRTPPPPALLLVLLLLLLLLLLLTAFLSLPLLLMFLLLSCVLLRFSFLLLAAFFRFGVDADDFPRELVGGPSESEAAEPAK